MVGVCMAHDIVYGICENKCQVPGIQGICETIEHENESDKEIVYFHDSKPSNNCRIVLKNYYSAGFAYMQQNPSADYNFHITFYKESGLDYILAPDGLCGFYYGSGLETGDQMIDIKWDNPNFSFTGLTVAHVDIWFDGINYCGHIDGY